MSNKSRLRLSRAGTIINMTSRQQETALGGALRTVIVRLQVEFGVVLEHKGRWKLIDLVNDLRREFAEVEFYQPSNASFMSPDGGVLSMAGVDGQLYPILIAEVKNQGTNDLREAEGKAKQSKGNAIERLGKNVIGFRTAFLKESIFPFVCFGYGIDFEEGSSILERVATIAMFGELNQTHLFNEGEGLFNRGSFYFRRAQWTEEEMTEIMYDIASRAIHYYYAKHSPNHFVSLELDIPE